MTDRFEELIQGSMPDMPDPEEYRRLNRVPLRKPVRRSPGLPKPGRSFVMATTCFALLVLLSGQISQLGSDDFELEERIGETAGGVKTKQFEDPNSSFSILGDISPEEALDLQQAFMARDATPVRATCLAYAGGEYWSVYGISETERDLEEFPMDLRGFLPKDDLPGFLEFYPRHFADLKNRSENLPPDSITKMTIFGVDFELKSWTKAYPGYGEVTYTNGYPIK